MDAAELRQAAGLATAEFMGTIDEDLIETLHALQEPVNELVRVLHENGMSLEHRRMFLIGLVLRIAEE